MLRLLAFIPEALLPLFLFFEVGVPWYRCTRYFPISRAVLYLATAPFRGPKSLTSAAAERLTQAERRLTAARADLKAAQLEAQAGLLEDETNNMREGKE